MLNIRGERGEMKICGGLGCFSFELGFIAIEVRSRKYVFMWSSVGVHPHCAAVASVRARTKWTTLAANKLASEKGDMGYYVGDTLSGSCAGDSGVVDVWWFIFLSQDFDCMT